MTLSFFPVTWAQSYLGYFSPVFSQPPIKKKKKPPQNLSHRSLLWPEYPGDNLRCFFLPRPLRDSGSQQCCRSRSSTDCRGKTGKLKFFCITGSSEWFKVHSNRSHICTHLIWLQPHFCLSRVIALAKGIWKILQRQWPSLDVERRLGRKTKFLIKIKLTLDCCTDKGKNAGNWVGTGNTSCPSWVGGWTDRWTDRYCTTYSHNWI